LVLAGSPHQRRLAELVFASVRIAAGIDQQLDRLGVTRAGGRHERGLAVREFLRRIGAMLEQQ
jgi:hypothetical protein